MSIFDFLYRNNRVINKHKKETIKINSFREKLINLSDNDFRNYVNTITEKIKNNSTHTNLEKYELFACVKEASRRILNMEHYDVQLICGLVLNNEKIAEMKTGEGKTISSTIPIIYQALLGKTVFAVTVNDYLAERDAKLLKPLYDFFNLSVSINLKANSKLISGLDLKHKQEIYSANIIYSTHSELCFDYMRRNTLKDKKDIFFEYYDNQNMFFIIDEIDSVLIDDAKNPLIISSKDKTSIYEYEIADELVSKILKRSSKEFVHNMYKKDTETHVVDGDFFYKDATREFVIYESGYEKIENFLIEKKIITEQTRNSIYSNPHIMLLINNALHAYYGFIKDRDYIIDDNKVVIIDHSTGRLHIGGRWQNGLHQAVECKEKLEIIPEQKISAQITYQSFFNLFKHKAGMTGTASTDALELNNVYGLETIIIPLNKPSQRNEHPDRMFISKSGKYQNLLEFIKQKHETGQPILIGTPALYISEEVAELLKSNNIPYELLNAKNHKREAEIIAKAGYLNSITISTNMAGRGTDIVLGSNLEEHEKITQLGGLCVIGVDRNSSKRIDNQLIGRCARQGDKGESIFFVSLDDELINGFAPKGFVENSKRILNKVGIEENKPMSSTFVSWNKSVDSAQAKVQQHYYDIRMSNYSAENIITNQREFFYKYRDDILKDKFSLSDFFIKSVISYFEKRNIDIQLNENTLDKIYENLYNELNIIVSNRNLIEQFDKINYELKNSKLSDEEILNKLINTIADILYQDYLLKWQSSNILVDKNIVEQTVKQNLQKLILKNIDDAWSDYLLEIDYIKLNSSLVFYAQKSATEEFKQRLHLNFIETFKIIEFNFLDTIIHEVSINPEKYEFSKELSDMKPEEVKDELMKLTKTMINKNILLESKTINISNIDNENHKN